MLEAIKTLSCLTPARLMATLLIHVPPVEPADRSTYIAAVCDALIPEAARRKLASAVDVFVEREAWHVDEARVFFACARNHGLAIKLHTEQFQRIGGLELGVAMGALSVDHLEACLPSQFAALAASASIATILPGVSLHLGIPAAPGRQLIDAGCAVAVGTDLNPGSSPLYSCATALALAVRLNGLTAQEALTSGTVNAACALGLHDTGRIETGLAADFLVLESSDWRDIVYTLGANPVREVWIRGEKVVTQ
jgi:imidazolonepropionase